MKKILLCMLALVIAGCASTAETVAKNDKGWRCDKYKVTGSHIPKKVCTTAYQREQAKIATEEMMQRRGHRAAPNLMGNTSMQEGGR